MHIRDEGIYSLEKGRTFYTSNAGLKELKVEIAKYLDRRYGMTYDYNKEIMVTVGGSEAIDIALRAMLDAGDEVIIPQPSYVSYVPCTVLAGGTPVIVELKEENDFRLTARSLKLLSLQRQRYLSCLSLITLQALSWKKQTLKQSFRWLRSMICL